MQGFIGYPEEIEFRQKGPWASCTIDIVVPFYNEERNVERVHQSNLKLDRLFNISRFIYVSNGPTDGTAGILRNLAERDPRVKVVTVSENVGYGYGLKKGLEAATADYILTNHADMQFDSYLFLMTHLSCLEALGAPRPIFPVRVNRPFLDAIASMCLRAVIRIMAGKAIRDFNGQPKLLPRQRVQANLSGLPRDFCADLALYLGFSPDEALFLPVLQAARAAGVSSWNRNPFSRLRLARRYLSYSWSLFTGRLRRG